MSDSVTSRGKALLSLLRSGGTAKAPPAVMLYRLADLLWEEGDLEDFGEVFRQAFLRMPMMWPSLETGPEQTLAARAEKLRRQARALIASEIRYAPVLAAL